MIQYPMTAPLHNHKDLRTLLLCALYAFVLLFFLSLDSYLYDLFYRTDSAVFFMCGKAWMNGLTPYADFADSKGPLLWLIYGIGYLLNHHSFVGVFWMSVIFYTATLFCTYKLCRLYLDARLSAICVAALPFALFLHWVNMETGSEDFCYTFVMYSLYALCRVIKEEAISKRTFFWLSVGMGISFMSCLLIKWNIGCMIGGIMLMTFILSFKRKAWALCLGGMVAGAAVIALPFLIYFFAFADFGAMIDEYFVNTYLSMHGRTNIMDTFTFDLAMIDREKFVLVLLIGMLLFTWRHKRYFWLLLCFLIFRVGLGSGHNGYFSILMPYAVFFLIIIVGFIFRKLPLLQRFVPLWCVLLAVFSIGSNYYFWCRVNDDHETTLAKREEFYKAEYLLSQLEKPKMFWFGYGCGLDVPVNALPACRYWIRQTGATEEMDAARLKSLDAGVAEIILYYTPLDIEETDDHAKIIDLGYVPYVTLYNLHGDLNCTLYGRPGLHLPPEDFHVSQWDVWLKRNIFGI